MIYEYFKFLEKPLTEVGGGSGLCCSYLPMSYPPTGPGPGPDSSLSDLVHGYTSTRRQATAPDNMAQAHLRNVEAEQQKQQVILRSLSDECAQVTSDPRLSRHCCVAVAMATVVAGAMLLLPCDAVSLCSCTFFFHCGCMLPSLLPTADSPQSIDPFTARANQLSP